jgi:tRNA A37 threonylcarbamoyladenosine dehydratase
MTPPNDISGSDDADLERRFGGLRRLYGDAAYGRLRELRVAVVGLGGVGSWSVEALARSGVAALTLIDLDHVAESNINRQVQADERTLGMAKVLALRDRVAAIHPGCVVSPVEAFVEAGNWPALLGGAPVDGVIDACDQVRAKLALAQWARAQRVPLVAAGAAGGKRLAHRVEVADLAQATHDPLLAALRQRLRKTGAPRAGALGVRCVFSREAVARPASASVAAGEGEGGAAACAAEASRDAAASVDGTLNCAGYGSSVAVTATFGLVAAGELMQRIATGAWSAAPR